MLLRNPSLCRFGRTSIGPDVLRLQPPFSTVPGGIDDLLQTLSIRPGLPTQVGKRKRRDSMAEPATTSTEALPAVVADPGLVAQIKQGIDLKDRALVASFGDKAQ